MDRSQERVRLSNGMSVFPAMPKRGGPGDHAVARAIGEPGEAVVEPLALFCDDEEREEYAIVAVDQALIEPAKSAA